VEIFAAEELAAFLREFPDDFAGPGGILAPGERARGEPTRKGTYVDDWGCVFECAEDGVDAVNSQLFCMDIEETARRFKGRISFWGEIDRQRVLPFGTVEEVRAAVGRVRRALDDPEGGVIAQCEWGKHNPRENIRAVFEAGGTRE
jgi:hypothetical protein